MSEQKTFTTSGGIELRIRPVSQLLIDKVRASVPMPDVPTYEDRIELPGQKPIVRNYKMRDGSEASTPAEIEAWESYQVALTEALKAQNQRMLEAILVPGVGMDLELPEDESWIEVQEYLGLEVPQGTIARKAHYLLTEVLVSPSDLGGLIVAIMQSSGVSEEAIRIAEESFRGAVRGTRRAEAE